MKAMNYKESYLSTHKLKNDDPAVGCFIYFLNLAL